MDIRVPVSLPLPSRDNLTTLLVGRDRGTAVLPLQILNEEDFINRLSQDTKPEHRLVEAIQLFEHLSRALNPNRIPRPAKSFLVTLRQKDLPELALYVPEDSPVSTDSLASVASVTPERVLYAQRMDLLLRTLLTLYPNGARKLRIEQQADKVSLIAVRLFEIADEIRATRGNYATTYNPLKWIIHIPPNTEVPPEALNLSKVPHVTRKNTELVIYYASTLTKIELEETWLPHVKQLPCRAEGGPTLWGNWNIRWEPVLAPYMFAQPEKEGD